MACPQLDLRLSTGAGIHQKRGKGPAPEGPSLDTTLAAMEYLAGTGRVVAFSVSSWNPAYPRAEEAAAATRRLAAPFAG